MKIAYVYDMTYPYNIGGAEIRNSELAMRLAKKHEVHMFGVKMWDGPDVLEKGGITLHGVCRYGGGNSFSGARSSFEPLKFAAKLISHLQGMRFDVIDASCFPYFHCFSCAYVAAKSRTPLVMTWHQHFGSYWPTYMGPVRGFLAQSVEKVVGRLTANHIAVSHKTRDDLMLAGIKRENIHVSYNGVDLELIRKAKPAQESYDMVYVGRLNHQKNVGLLVDAMGILKKKMPDVKACIIGDGPDMAKLKKQVERLELSDNIRFTGMLPDRNEVYSLMKSSKVFVLPSRMEGFGIVVAEANACGLPAVVVDSQWNAAKELVDGCGLVSQGSPQSVAAAAGRLIGDDAMRMRMGAAAYERASLLDWGAVADDVEKYYGGLLDGNQA